MNSNKISLKNVLFVLIALVSLAGIILISTSEPIGQKAQAANGFGSKTVGGNNGTVVRVTNLNDSGTGSLRGAISQSNRNIVFDVEGTINLLSDLEIRNLANITIDGSTAPGKGITLKNNGLVIRSSHDIIVRHLRIRDTSNDSLLVWNGSYNVIIEHNSLTNGGDETLSITENTRDVTVAWNIIGSTRSDWTTKSAGTLVANFNQAPVTNLSLHHNLWTNLLQRSPQISTAGLFDMRNNVIKEWASYGTRIRAGGYGNIINNVYESAGKPHNALILVADGTLDAGQVHVSGNIHKNGTNINALSTKSSPYETAPINTDPAEKVEQIVLGNVGALPRDNIDIQLAGASAPECNDLIDNDEDNKIDFPSDPGCSSSTDNDESNPTTDNNPPTANAGPDQTIEVNQSITLNGSGQDPDNDPLTFQWDFLDGIVSSGATAIRTYTSVGTYNATLTVTDSKGATSMDSVVITVIAPSVAPGTNIALKKPSTQSSTYSKYYASYAVDGKNNVISLTKHNPTPWWQVDLGSIQKIDIIKIWNHTKYTTRLSNYYVLVSDTPFASTNISNAINQPGVWSQYETKPAGYPTTLSPNRTGRYVRIQNTNTGYLQIAEVQVISGK
jgi:hypothetical protein